MNPNPFAEPQGSHHSRCAESLVPPQSRTFTPCMFCGRERAEPTTIMIGNRIHPACTPCRKSIIPNIRNRPARQLARETAELLGPQATAQNIAERTNQTPAQVRAYLRGTNLLAPRTNRKLHKQHTETPTDEATPANA